MKGFSIGIFNLKSLVPENQYACSIRMQFSSRNRVAFFPSFFFFAVFFFFLRMNNSWFFYETSRCIIR